MIFQELACQLHRKAHLLTFLWLTLQFDHLLYPARIQSWQKWTFSYCQNNQISLPILTRSPKIIASNFISAIITLNRVPFANSHTQFCIVRFLHYNRQQPCLKGQVKKFGVLGKGNVYLLLSFFFFCWLRVLGYFCKLMSFEIVKKLKIIQSRQRHKRPAT